jgi:hypothetical protein
MGNRSAGEPVETWAVEPHSLTDGKIRGLLEVAVQHRVRFPRPAGPPRIEGPPGRTSFAGDFREAVL